MKYIDKNNKQSIEAANTLHHWRDHFEQNGKNFKQIAQEITSEEAWKLIDEKKGLKTELRKALYEEQKGVCCYCVQELVLGTDLQTTSTVIEHFLPKSANIEANTYDYKNLLLSCDGNNGASSKESKYQISKKGSSWEDIVTEIQKQESKNPDFTMDVASLKRMNPSQATKLSPKGQLLYKLSPQHCDKYKKNKTDIIVNPTDLPDCWDRFQYNANGFIEGVDEIARKTVLVLNLNAAKLQKYRAQKWIEFENEFNTNEIISEYIAGEDWIGLKNYIKSEFDVEMNLTYPFCVVRRAFLRQEIEKYNF